ncbi:hypothetical protein [Mycolicibacterium fortuitum]|uniref:Uncharacterized protein n=1 Tax=Mycolicibacterium fortuitum TaxID=1766 RepID=A0AAE5AED2_MYCFO|nr:hypothetical protein [Mycolicibacterium fortuitum]MCV7142558.1 hypothetical protein [Mycolicibacterium fortuitum]MDV7193725.1 hypothetical protein [Mycolicibacterium fortuitum]MDV7207134.1 hypothetical protein [Mycolicibacterium fortuitum]MDV7228645.1 hypothetical protein [Mycolicibacterium fortuitum]MDV7260591.1 hypothetical protein [Mycolicibacterium fortuitum]
MALVTVIGVTAVVTLSVADKGDTGGRSSPPAAAPPNASAGSATNSDVASANDTGPVGVILEDPSCRTQHPVISTYIKRTTNGWDKRDPAAKATDWTPEVRGQYEAAAEAFRDAADQLIPSAKLTPHRVMRELYEQFIAYARAYADSIPAYTPIDNNLASVAISASDAISRICAAIDYGSAAARGPLVPALPAPSEVAAIRDPSDAQKLLTDPNPVCPEWDSATQQWYTNIEAWSKTDPDIPGADWSPEQRKINDDMLPVMKLLNTQLSALGRKSANPTLRDFADLSVQYRKAYLEALPTYTAADKYLVSAASRTANVVGAACQALG